VHFLLVLTELLHR